MAIKVKKVCLYCESGKEPSYTDSSTLRKFMSDRSRIISRIRSGACAKHQREISRQIKYARHLAILPFITTV